MRDDLTCWDSVPEFTGARAALAIVGEPQTDDPAKLLKASPVLDLLRRAYEGTRRWFADAPEDGDTPPRGLLVSVEMQAAMGRVVQLDDVVADYPYCVWPRTSEHVSLLFAGEPERRGEHGAELNAAGAGDVRFLTWLRTPMADFDRQTFTREVLARWVQDVGASTLYPFTPRTADNDKPQAARVMASTVQDAEILRAIERAGYDPKRLPKNEPGKPGVKKAVRDVLKKQPPFKDSVKVFDHAWERLRQSGDIADAA